MFNITETKQAITIGEPPNMSLKKSGKPSVAIGTWFSPIPKTKDNPTISLSLAFKASEVNISIPVKDIWENIIIEAPPITAWGSVDMRAPNFGISPAAINIREPSAKIYLLMIL